MRLLFCVLLLKSHVNINEGHQNNAEINVAKVNMEFPQFFIVNGKDVKQN